MCGDLYPTRDERDILLSTLQAFCGRFSTVRGSSGEYNIWYDSKGKKHKGTVIADLERARLDPASWGVDCLADPLVPDRPRRPISRVPHNILFTPPSFQMEEEQSDSPREPSPALSLNGAPALSSSFTHPPQVAPTTIISPQVISPPLDSATSLHHATLQAAPPTTLTTITSSSQPLGLASVESLAVDTTCTDDQVENMMETIRHMENSKAQVDRCPPPPCTSTS